MWRRRNKVNDKEHDCISAKLIVIFENNSCKNTKKLFDNYSTIAFCSNDSI